MVAAIEDDKNNYRWFNSFTFKYGGYEFDYRGRYYAYVYEISYLRNTKSWRGVLDTSRQLFSVLALSRFFFVRFRRAVATERDPPVLSPVKPLELLEFMTLPIPAFTSKGLGLHESV